MVNRKSGENKITVIVPAYNEASRIGRVLKVLTAYPFHEIIVVNDGSTDNTDVVVAGYEVKYLKNDRNRGKGYSMRRAVEQSSGDILFFCDADIAGLDEETIQSIIDPVIRGDFDMFVAMRHRRAFSVRPFMRLIDWLGDHWGGERALTRELWDLVPNEYKEGFEIETALNFYAKHQGKGYSYRIYRNLSEPIKEQKYGWREGTVQRWKMNMDIARAKMKLHFWYAPRRLKIKRIAILTGVLATLGLWVGLLMLIFARGWSLFDPFRAWLIENNLFLIVGPMLTTRTIVGLIGAITIISISLWLLRRSLRIYAQVQSKRT